MTIDHEMIYESPSERVDSRAPIDEDFAALDLLDRLSPPAAASSPTWFAESRLLGIVAAAERLKTAQEEERLAAPYLATQLERHPETRARILINNRPRFHTWGLAEELIDRALGSIFANDPCRSVRLSRLAVVVTDHLEPAHYPQSLAADLRARAWGNLGNSYRCAGQLRSAASALQQAEEILLQGTGDPLEEATLLSFAASLETDSGQYATAIELLERTCSIYRELGEQSRLARTLVQLVIPMQFQNPGSGVEIARSAERLLDPDKDAELFLHARHNHVTALVDSNRPEQAAMLLEASRRFYRRSASPWAELNLAWTEARLSAALGDLEEAEAGYEVLLQEVLESDRRLEGALVALDLAACRLSLGKTREAAELAASMSGSLQSWGANAKAREAWALLQHSLRVERASVELVHEVAQFLRKAWQNPDLPLSKSLAARREGA